MKNNMMESIPTHTLIKLLSNAYDSEDQNLINIYAYELARRSYGKSTKMSFFDLMKDFGYKDDKELVLKQNKKE